MSDALTPCLTPPVLAKRWRCTPARVVTLIKRGDLAGFTLSPATARRPRWLVNPDDVLAFERARATTPQPKATRRRNASKPTRHFT